MPLARQPPAAYRHRDAWAALLRLAEFPATAAANRRLAALPWHALALLGCPRT